MEDEAGRELAQDKAHLVALYTSALARVETLVRELESSKNNYLPRTYDVLLGHAENMASQLRTAQGDLNACEFSLQQKKEYSDMLRVLDAGVASLLAAPNWQSPSFWHSTLPQAGRETGRVSVSKNDYKRDMHKDERAYGQAFVKEYIEHPLRLAPFAFPTSSGMSAVATVLIHVGHSLKNDTPVLAGKGSYFQNKWQLEHLFPGRVHWVDEFDTQGLLARAKELEPGLVFLDSLCGAESLPMPDLHTLVPGLSKILGSASTLVIDNTILATMYQPLRDLPINPFGMKLIVVESLLKFHQFGMDRVGGGIIWAPMGSDSGLFEARMHVGTIMPDMSVLALPEPNRKLFDERLLRIGRNARLFAERLHAHIEGSGIRVNHPALPHYRGYAWTKDLAFQGPFVTITFTEGSQTVSHYDAFVARVHKAAQQAGIDIVGGTSFGFDTTRVYVTARYATNITEPFVRISLGTETREEVERLADVCAEALRV